MNRSDQEPELPPWARELLERQRAGNERASGPLDGGEEEEPLFQRNPRLRENAELLAATSSKELKEFMIQTGLVREDELLQAMEHVLDMERVDWESVVVTPELLEQIPEEDAWRLHVFPVRHDAATVWIAMADPYVAQTIEELEAATGKRVIGMIASEGEILRRLGEHYG